MRVRWLCTALAGLAPALAGASADEDPRARILVTEDCVSSVGHREVTLFANGTIRRREGPAGAEEMSLGEVGSGEVEAWLNRLSEPDLGETDADPGGPEGAWIESCTLELRLPGSAPQTFRYDRYSSPSLALGALVRVVRDIEAAIDPRSREIELPGDYQPQIGDLLERLDGVRFEIVAFTADDKGIELSSPEQPLTLYIPREEVRLHFQRLLRRGW